VDVPAGQFERPIVFRAIAAHRKNKECGQHAAHDCLETISQDFLVNKKNNTIVDQTSLSEMLTRSSMKLTTCRSQEDALGLN
jgi:hypothetical protein